MTSSGPESATGLACGEVRGGTTPVYDRFALPGLRGVLYSRPCSGASGGDIHYLSVCGSGLVSRVCVADVAGHGETIAVVGTAMHAHLLRSVDVIDERKVLTRMDRQLEASGLRAMTTAALLTYVSPSRRLTVAYAGHPPGWLYRAREKTWGRSRRRARHCDYTNSRTCRSAPVWLRSTRDTDSRSNPATDC